MSDFSCLNIAERGKPVPFLEREDGFGWGVWSEVDETAFMRYVALYSADASPDEPLAAGSLANDIQCYSDATAFSSGCAQSSRSKCGYGTRNTSWLSESIAGAPVSVP